MPSSPAASPVATAPRTVIAATIVFAIIALFALIDLHRAVDRVADAGAERSAIDGSIHHAALAKSRLAAREFDAAAVTAEITEGLRGLDDLLGRRAPTGATAADEPPSTIVALARYSRTGLVAALALSRAEPAAPEDRSGWIARQDQRLDQALGLLGQLVIEIDAEGVAVAASRRASAVVLAVGLLGLAAIAFQAWSYRSRRRG